MAYKANTGMAISHRQPLTRQHRKLHRDTVSKHSSRKRTKERKFTEGHRYHQIQYLEQDTTSYRAR